jgi:hypothetical protein
MITIPVHFKGKTLKSTYPYHDQEGNVVGVVGRYHDENENKVVIPHFEQLNGAWEPGIKLTPRPLFGLKNLANHAANKAVFVVEGEKAATALHSLNICAVTSIGGANAASKTDWSILQKYPAIFLLPDNDIPGEEYIRDVYKLLIEAKTDQTVKIIRFPNLCKGGDIVDWLQKLRPEWDGFSPFPSVHVDYARKLLQKEMQSAESVPADWGAVNCTDQSTHLEWEKPNEIVSKVPGVQKLEPRLIPPVFAPWLTDISYRMQTPPDFVAVTLLVCISSIIGAGCGVRPKEKDNWEVIPNTWGSCVGRPSVLKSPSMNEVLKHLVKLQNKYHKIHKNKMQEFQFESMIAKTRLEEIKKQLSKKGKIGGQAEDQPSFDQLKEEFIRLSENEDEPPTRRIFKTNEVSIQSMTMLQNENPRGILFVRDELTGLLCDWQQEQNTDVRTYFLEGWNGNGSYTDTKIGRGVTDAEQICISMIGGIQPDMLAKYFSTTFKGNNDGLIQRFQLAVYPDEQETWEYVDVVPNKDAALRTYDIMDTLAEMKFIDFGAEQNEHDIRPFFRFDDEAQVIFKNWLTELQLIKLKNEENPFMVEHFGKYRSLMPSLALIFHCIELASGLSKGRITARSAQLAVDWCSYLESHARRIYANAKSRENQAAETLAKKIMTGQLRNEFTAKTVYDKGWHGFSGREEVELACRVLINENWLIMTIPPKAATGRTPLPIYHINPAILSKQGN